VQVTLKTVGVIEDCIYKLSRENLFVPQMNNLFQSNYMVLTMLKFLFMLFLQTRSIKCD